MTTASPESLTATCHCGAVQVRVPSAPDRLTSCNCSICRRTGGLWAYYADSEVELVAAPDATDEYIWGDRTLRLIRCRTCGVVIQWKSLDPATTSKAGVNARNFHPAVIGSIPIRSLDGADTWEFIGDSWTLDGRNTSRAGPDSV